MRKQASPLASEIEKYVIFTRENLRLSVELRNQKSGLYKDFHKKFAGDEEKKA